MGHDDAQPVVITEDMYSQVLRTMQPEIWQRQARHSSCGVDISMLPGPFRALPASQPVLGSKAWAHVCLCLRNWDNIRVLLSLPDGPGEQLGPAHAPSLHRLCLPEAVWTLRHTDPGLRTSGEKSLHALVSPSSNWVWRSPPCSRTHRVECGKMVEKY